ncbi:7142_t:CDS:2 [Diversispora eburnea]|uniref:7142_t:CDS:1 n=1 Tax=Diversispora eburnea TaxID=1213867 RepID=A0A9N8V480_9GLOM|nr:7142_t:CDS:2 [Diversispora eburnea]
MSNQNLVDLITINSLAENNGADSQFYLGEYFYEGCGTKKDIVNAIYWLNKANENGNSEANDF